MARMCSAARLVRYTLGLVRRHRGATRPVSVSGVLCVTILELFTVESK